MKLLLTLAALLLVVGLVWLTISVNEATERGRVPETPIVTPVGVLTPAETSGESVLAAPPQPAPSEPASRVDEVPPAPSTDEPARPSSATATIAKPYTPPDPARFAEKYEDIDARSAAQRAGQLRNQVELRAASVLSDSYYKDGRYTAWPYTYDARGKREPATSAIPRTELEPIHRIYDAPEERAWHLVVVTPAERPDLYDLRQESKWLGSRGRGGDE